MNKLKRNIKARTERKVQNFYFVFKKNQRPICYIKGLLTIANKTTAKC
jgi:hypothetical protein